MFRMPRGRIDHLRAGQAPSWVSSCFKCDSPADLLAMTCRLASAAVPFCFAPSGPVANHEHNRTCRSRIARACAVATGAADRRNFDPASHRCARVADLRSETGPARHRDGRNPCRECVWRETDPGSDLSPDQVRRPTSRHRSHPWRRLCDGRAGDEGCGEQALRVRAEMRDLFRGSPPRAGSTAPGAGGGHLLGVCLAARECQSTRSRSRPYR